jgi:predicted RNA-binding protein (virulence factor B family)
MNDDGLRRDYFRLFGISKDEFKRRLGKIGFGDC